MLVILILEHLTSLAQPTSAMTNLSLPTAKPDALTGDAQHPNDVFGRLFRACEHLPAVRCAVVHPCDADSLGGAVAAALRGGPPWCRGLLGGGRGWAPGWPDRAGAGGATGQDPGRGQGGWLGPVTLAHRRYRAQPRGGRCGRGPGALWRGTGFDEGQSA